MKQIQNSEIELNLYAQLIASKVANKLNGEIKFYQQMVLEQLDKREPQPLPNSIKKVNLCWIIDLKLTDKIKVPTRQYRIISS